MPRRRAVTWCRPLIGPHRYDAVIGEPETCPDLEGNDEASTDWEACRIAIRRSLADERKGESLGHEALGHATLEAFGLRQAFQHFLKLTDEQWEEFEEKCICRQLVPAQFAVMKANGWLKLPRVPKSARTSPATSVRQSRKKRRAE